MANRDDVLFCRRLRIEIQIRRRKTTVLVLESCLRSKSFGKVNVFEPWTIRVLPTGTTETYV
jgi:hypothetical protein